jgi:hypothetical protein
MLGSEGRRRASPGCQQFWKGIAVPLSIDQICFHHSHFREAAFSPHIFRNPHRCILLVLNWYYHDSVPFRCSDRVIRYDKIYTLLAAQKYSISTNPLGLKLRQFVQCMV